MAQRASGEVHPVRTDLTEAQLYAHKSLHLAQAEPVLTDQVEAAMELLEEIRRAQQAKA